MSGLIVPAFDDVEWPSLGEALCEWIEANLVFGPGDLRGERAVLDDEKRALVYRAYQVYPKDHPQAGRRRFRRVAISLRKGVAKTEWLAWIAACELHPNAPVRCIGWDGDTPRGGGVTDPYIPLVAYTEEQSDELAYGALRCILAEGPLRDDFDIGLERIIRKDGAGKAVSLATAPGARDGARTTFQGLDETHRFVLPRQKAAVRTMLANLPKRKLADPWSLEVTTAFSPGEQSVAEDTMTYAREVAEGQTEDARLFFFHRQASASHDIETKEGLRAAIIEASGPTVGWSDINGIAEQFDDPTADRSFLERVWLNRPTTGSRRAFDLEKWDELTRPKYQPAAGTLITLGFDGARHNDATSLVGCDVAEGVLFLLGLWERPHNVDQWEVPAEEVKSVVASAFATWTVWRFYCDPPFWDGTVDDWAGEFGEERVIKWWTNRIRPMGDAVRAFHGAIAAGELSHDGDPDLRRHVGNAVRKELRVRDDEQRPLWGIQKERPDSLLKIDAAMASILAWEARGDAVASGAAMAPEQPSVFFVGE